MAKIIVPPYFDSVVNAGEKRLLDYLQVNLPDSFYLVPNVELASTNPRNNRTQYWEYDLLIVAPHAIYNIENKDWKGRIEGDDNYWYVNDRQRQNPLKTGRQKTAVLTSKLREHEPSWARAWIQNMVTLSYPNTYAPSLWQESAKLTFQLNEQLINYLTDPQQIGKSEDDIADIYKEIVKYLDGSQSKKAPDEKREVEGYEIIEILQQEPNFTEYLVKPKGVTSSIRKRVKEYSLQVAGLSQPELLKREEAIKNQYKALHKIKAKPFILNVEFKIDEENHQFYEISDFLDENSLRAEARSKTFTFQEKLGIVRNVMAALKEAHKESIFHRDINPDNIYMSSGYAYLGNFGKSYFTDHNQQGYTVMATINESNATPYHPLELTVGDASRSSDIYSLGVLIYWLFTGEEPFKTPYDLDKMGGKLPTDKLPTTLNKALPKWLDELSLKTILTDDLKRLDSIEQVEKFIEDALKENDSEVPSKRTTRTTTAQSTDIYELKVGDKIGDYVIHQILGKGGYSRVFKVKHQLQGKYYALKLFHESVNANSVIDEYNALVGLEHHNIVKFVWNGETPNGQFYTLMEFLEGENLSTYSRTDAKLPIYRVYQIAKDILSALVSMQNLDKPILHRDIKPQNIIWDNEKRFVLIDFNVASFVDDNQDFVGTNPYLAPDLIADGYKVNWDKSADTFALGITLYELICKEYPWTPKKMPVLSIDPVNPKEFEPRISDAFAEFLSKAINPRSAKRFSNSQEMLDALLSIGEDGFLQETKTATPTAEAKDEEGNFIKYINSLYSQSKGGNFGTRASETISEYDRLTYTPSKLDKKLLPDILDGKYKLLIITGNAGDGKTAFIKRIEHDDSVKNLNTHEHKNGARFKINGVQFESNYDGSQDEDQRANNEVLESFFEPFSGLSNYNKSKEGRIIAINEGRLVEFLKTTSKHKTLHDTIENYFYNEGHHELPSGLMIINLNLRSVAAQDNQEPSLFRSQVKALTQKDLWAKCKTCPLANKCFIKYNVDSFNDSASGEEVITRMEWLLRTASLKRELHITMRDLRSFVAFTLTRDHECADIEQLVAVSENQPESYWQYYYFNITNPSVDDSGNQDRLIKLLRETDIGEVATPDKDRDLFFGQHETNEYLEFSDREYTLIDEFNNNKIWVPAHEQDGTLIKRIRVIQKVFIRHQYFEGKSELLSVENGYVPATTETQEAKFPSYLLRLPYHSVFKFVKVLTKGDEGANTKTSISRAISLNEGCDNPGIDKDHLVLASTDIRDPYSKSFRLFDLNDFELFVNRTDHLVKYLEYEPDSLSFRHKIEKHIKLTISLDLYEMLYFIQQGFSPSLNDLRGKFIELIIFKNLLENLTYKEVVVTSDNLEFYRISKDEQSRLYIEPMEV
ncbi:methylation-associated defense system protein kinase MAD6 [Roseivirga pacifica]|uniref:methylation-associated defense system protein kinase MAD6 n=1 Tax=Roseivirga pacifica TaxID=1267423 RepID=UPI0020960FF2|nr:protein kinase [Roseivirga pacifica]MCO6359035.1 protein kinase [Roseivirga pacifica]MCO6365329.1 protein kinase [Roseivirga pacifica]MCO6371941.1 protein kinase [Roseivirga pacifica]MCO6375948.1 protein kinase [Roseivirga pacifica]MCO6379319.1 protein kinase [Roseivirga pacifica]